MLLEPFLIARSSFPTVPASKSKISEKLSVHQKTVSSTDRKSKVGGRTRDTERYSAPTFDMFVNLANEEDRDREIGKKTLRALIITKPSCNFTLPVVLAQTLFGAHLEAN